MRGRQCETCEFFVTRSVNLGECRRRAPVMRPKDGAAVWPKTCGSEWWCGEWQAKDEVPEIHSADEESERRADIIASARTGGRRRAAHR